MLYNQAFQIAVLVSIRDHRRMIPARPVLHRHVLYKYYAPDIAPIQDAVHNAFLIPVVLLEEVLPFVIEQIPVATADS